MEEGYEVFGITLKLFENPEVEIAKSVAKKLGIKHYVLDLSEYFQVEVVDRFIDTYLEGKTPNPCLYCNKKIKYGRMLEEAKKLGADYVALGHYACITKEIDGSYHIYKAKAARKDQSYVLYQLKQEQLESILLPLGSLESKDEVRKILKEQIPEIAHKKDSNDICFTDGVDFREFIQIHRPNIKIEGDFVLSTGEVLGKHKGYYHYTIGQKRGLGLSHDNRYFVSEIRNKERQVVVTMDEMHLYKNEIFVTDLTFINDRYKEYETLELEVKLCQWGYFIKATLHQCSGYVGRVVFQKPERAPAPGQGAVFYIGDELIGGGTIHS